MSSGGTESILLAMFTYRRRAAKLRPRITAPEVIVPETIHPAFDYLYGNIPGRPAYEYQWNAKWYGGAGCRAPTNSYRLRNGEYIRLDDNQLSLYVDYYALPQWCVTLELGSSVFRRLQPTPYSFDGRRTVDNGFGPFVRLSTAYLMRL